MFVIEAAMYGKVFMVKISFCVLSDLLTGETFTRASDTRTEN
jgi:hypothetical protein